MSHVRWDGPKVKSRLLEWYFCWPSVLQMLPNWCQSTERNREPWPKPHRFCIPEGRHVGPFLPAALMLMPRCQQLLVFVWKICEKSSDSRLLLTDAGLCLVLHCAGSWRHAQFGTQKSCRPVEFATPTEFSACLGYFSCNTLISLFLCLPQCQSALLRIAWNSSRRLKLLLLASENIIYCSLFWLTGYYAEGVFTRLYGWSEMDYLVARLVSKFPPNGICILAQIVAQLNVSSEFIVICLGRLSRHLLSFCV